MTGATLARAMTVREWISGLASLITALTVVIGTFGGMAWFALASTITPYLELPGKLNRIEATIDTLAQRLPIIQLVEFQSVAVAIPPRARPGERITISFTLRRNSACAAEFIDRFYSFDLGAVDPHYTTQPRAVARAAVTQDFRPWSRVLTIPDDLPPGQWALSAEITPLGECLGQPPIYPPLAHFEVVAP